MCVCVYCVCVCVWCVHVCVCVCVQASRSPATLSCDRSYFSYWQGCVCVSKPVAVELHCHATGLILVIGKAQFRRAMLS